MLTDVALKALKPREKIYKVADRDGMYVRVTPRGAISFLLDCRNHSSEILPDSFFAEFCRT